MATIIGAPSGNESRAISVTFPSRPILAALRRVVTEKKGHPQTVAPCPLHILCLVAELGQDLVKKCLKISPVFPIIPVCHKMPLNPCGIKVCWHPWNSLECPFPRLWPQRLPVQVRSLTPFKIMSRFRFGSGFLISSAVHRSRIVAVRPPNELGSTSQSSVYPFLLSPF